MRARRGAVWIYGVHRQLPARSAFAVIAGQLNTIGSATPPRCNRGGVRPMPIVARRILHYLDEFTFRFNRRTSGSRGLLFQRLVEQALALSPVRGDELVRCTSPQRIPVAQSSA